MQVYVLAAAHFLKWNEFLKMKRGAGEAWLLVVGIFYLVYIA